MRTRRLGIWLACILTLAMSGARVDAEEIRVVPLVRDGRVLVTFELPEGLGDDLQEAIRSGLRATISYTIDLRLQVPVWINRTIASVVVTNSIQYDNLTRRHSLSRLIDGRIEESLVTGDNEFVQQWMTGIRQMPLFDTALLEPNREYYVRVRARARPRTANILWPWSGDPSGQTKFTFLP